VHSTLLDIGLKFEADFVGTGKMFGINQFAGDDSVKARALIRIILKFLCLLSSQSERTCNPSSQVAVTRTIIPVYLRDKGVAPTTERSGVFGKG
jgi:hypothetical protein